MNQNERGDGGNSPRRPGQMPRRSGPQRSQPEGPQWGRMVRPLVIWMGLIFLVLAISQQFAKQTPKARTLTYDSFKQYLEAGKVESITVEENSVHGQLRASAALEGQRAFQVTLPPRASLETFDEWIKKYEVEILFKESGPSIWSSLIYIVPWVLFIGIWIFFMRRMQGANNKGIFAFGKSRARMWTDNMPHVTFADVAGADEAKQELREIIEFLREPEKFQRLGGKIPKGALLLGPPGTGKTLLAKAVAGEAGVPFFSMSGADFVEMFVGVGASRVRDLFEQGKHNAPCIIFIDELDAVGRHRGAGLGGGHDEREQTLNQLLVEMDGFDSNEGVILIAATNRPDVLDSALLRPGRFDRQIVVDRPDVRGREGILKVHTKKIPLARSVDLAILAKGTPGFSGADLANMVNEAALLAARRDKTQVEAVDFEEAKDKVLMGIERKSLLISEDEKKSTAYHEAGHVLVARLTPGSDPVHKVSIIPRGRALGITTMLPMDEKHNYSRTYCQALMRQLLGGRAAEQLILNELTTGAGDDIKRVTELARKMVCEWGMSEKLGPLTFGEKQEEIFLGREIAQHRDYSESTAHLIDQEVRDLVEVAAADVARLLRENVDLLHAIAGALLEREMLDGEEIDKIMNGVALPRLKRAKKEAGGAADKSRARKRTAAAASPAATPAATSRNRSKGEHTEPQV
ncbi:MAG TPA: ATP-dependent zinc metalloprotease FtsH [bacterium]|nr:ATP-dependent zinc metalloprotease FtsH [bacterium]HPR88296.1 ATP-dependent zinc metalloprotease FtsH [bacterium]